MIVTSPKIVELAKEAYELQNACNMLGLSKRFAEAVQELADELRRFNNGVADTDVISQHVVTQAWVSKLDSLSGASSSATLFRNLHNFIQAA